MENRFFPFSSFLKDGFLSSKYYRELHKYKISNQLILPQFVLKILEFLILVEGWIVVVRRVSWIHATTTSWNWISCWNPCHWVAWFSTWNPISRSCGGMNRIFPFLKGWCNSLYKRAGSNGKSTMMDVTQIYSKTFWNFAISLIA